MDDYTLTDSALATLFEQFRFATALYGKNPSVACGILLNQAPTRLPDSVLPSALFAALQKCVSLAGRQIKRVCERSIDLLSSAPIGESIQKSEQSLLNFRLCRQASNRIQVTKFHRHAPSYRNGLS